MADKKYTKEHEWIKVEGTTATIGISVYAAHALGDITFVELPKIGTSFRQMQRVGTIESIKAVSDMYAPVSGKISKINSSLDLAPELVGQDPEGNGWICVMEDFNKDEYAALMNTDQYKDFLATVEK